MKKSYLVGLAAGVLVLCGVVIANAAYIDFENIDIGSVGTCSTGLEPTCVFQSQGFIFSFTAQIYAPLSNISNMIIADKTIYTTVQNETKFLMTTRIPELMINQLHPFTINFEPAAEVSFDLDLSNPLAGYRIDALDANGQLISSIYATSDGSYNFVNYTTLISSVRLGVFGDSVVAGFAIDNIHTTAPVPEPPFCVSTASELHNALTTAANNGQDDIIRLVQGTYNGNFIYTSTESYGLTIEGGYTANCASKVINPENTVLDAGGSGPVLVLSSPDVKADFVVGGVTLQNGNVIGNNSGGLFIKTNAGNVTLTGNRFYNNSSSDKGGGIFIDHPQNVTLDNNFLNGNNSGGRSGAIWINIPSSAILTNNTIINAQKGSGVTIWQGRTVSLENNIMSNNIGNGLEIYDCATITLDNNTFDNNDVTSYGSDGGGIYIRGADLATLTNNTISNNKGQDGGGAKFDWPNVLNLTNNIIANNSSDRGGGAFIFRPTEVNLVNNTIFSNSCAETGGAIFLWLDIDAAMRIFTTT